MVFHRQHFSYTKYYYSGKKNANSLKIKDHKIFKLESLLTIEKLLSKHYLSKLPADNQKKMV